MLAVLQAYRGFAAVLVVLYHAEATANAKTGAASSLFTFGWSGVQFFFVLSGYVIWHVHAKDIGEPRANGSNRPRSRGDFGSDETQGGSALLVAG